MSSEDSLIGPNMPLAFMASRILRIWTPVCWFTNSEERNGIPKHNSRKSPSASDNIAGNRWWLHRGQQRSAPHQERPFAVGADVDGFVPTDRKSKRLNSSQ